MVRVQYDDAAFYIFAIAVLGVYAFPATYIAAGKIMRTTVLAKSGIKRAPLPGEGEKSKQLRDKNATGIWTPWFKAQLVILGVVWIFLFVLLSSYSAGGCVRFCVARAAAPLALSYFFTVMIPKSTKRLKAWV